MQYEEPMVEILILDDDMDVITMSDPTGGLGNIGGEPGEDSDNLDNL